MAIDLATLRTKLNNLADENVDATKANLWINETQKDFTNRFRWSWLEAKSSVNTVAGTYSYTLPSDFSNMLEVKVADLTATVPTAERLEKVSRDYLAENYPNFPEVDEVTATQNTPARYTVYTGALWLHPIPDKQYATYFKYFKDVTDLANDTDESIIPAEYRDALAWGAYAKWLIADEADQNQIDTALNMYENLIRKALEKEQLNSDTSGGYITWTRRDLV